jgi:hypothetical protein
VVGCAAGTLRPQVLRRLAAEWKVEVEAAALARGSYGSCPEAAWASTPMPRSWCTEACSAAPAGERLRVHGRQLEAALLADKKHCQHHDSLPSKLTRRQLVASGRKLQSTSRVHIEHRCNIVRVPPCGDSLLAWVKNL